MSKTIAVIGTIQDGTIEYLGIDKDIIPQLEKLKGHEGLIDTHSPLKHGQVVTNGHREIRITRLDWNEDEAKIYAQFKNVNFRGRNLSGYRPVDDLIEDGYK